MSEWKKDSLYLNTDGYGEFDDWTFPLDKEDLIRDIKNTVEMIVDDQTLKNEDEINGIEFKVKITTLTKEEYDNIAWDHE